MTQNDKKSNPPAKSGATDGSDDTQREGPATMPQGLDEAQQWDDVASEPGFQKGNQGGYRGHYDETKFEETEARHFPDTKDEAAAKGSGGKSSQPVKQTTKEAEAAADENRDRSRDVTGTQKKSS